MQNYSVTSESPAFEIFESTKELASDKVPKVKVQDRLFQNNVYYIT